MANVGTAAAGKTLIGQGNTTSPKFTDIGTDSGLTEHGVLLAQGSNAFTATAIGVDGSLLIGATGADPAMALPTSNDGSILWTPGANTLDAGVNTNSFPYAMGAYNLGIKFSGSDFFVCAGNGGDLSSANTGRIVINSVSNPGRFNTYAITANQGFTDATGSSDIIGNLFGFVSGVATDTVPFFIYAVQNDAENDIAFMISRIPGQSLSPTASLIGIPGTPATNNQRQFFSFKTITPGDYDSNACLCIGSFRMAMNTSDDWAFNAPSEGSIRGRQDGIGYFQEGIIFTQSLGQFGANSGTLTIANGGTAPVFTTVVARAYSFIGNSPFINYHLDLINDGGTDGAGAVTAALTMPFQVRLGSASNSAIVGTARVITPTYTEDCLISLSVSTNTITLYRSNSANFVQWGDFTNGARRISLYITTRINTDS